MKPDEKKVLQWLQEEFDAKPDQSKKNEFYFHCPFCDKKKQHKDYAFNLEKMKGHCWRGFSPECESGHNIFSLVALYYDIEYRKACVFVDKNLQIGNKIALFKKKLRGLNEEIIDLSSDYGNVHWDIPRESIEIWKEESKNGRRCMKWLLKERKIPPEVIYMLKPVTLIDGYEGRRWSRHVGRVFFPVISDDNRGWLSYFVGKPGKNDKKTLNPPGSILSNMLFLYDNYRRSTEPVLICEGIFDALRMFIFGYNAVAVFGTNISDAQISLLNQLPSEEVVVCLDADASETHFDKKKGVWTSKTLRLAKVLSESFFKKVSFMKLKFGDPDEQTFSDVQECFNHRAIYGRGRVGTLKYRMSKLASVGDA